MLFNSIEFLIFLTLFLCLYWQIKSVRHRNLFILLSSYIFYGWWDYRFLSLIIVSSFADFLIGKSIFNSKDIKLRKKLLFLSLAINLGMLGFFKYYNFFIDSFIDAFQLWGVNLSIHSLNIVLPVGISFYTFQTLSYTIDIYRKKIEPTTSIINFFAYVSFFPQLVAGPIERAKNLLPQFSKIKPFDSSQFKEGGKQMLWGFFKKIAIADQCAFLVNDIFANYEMYSPPILIIGAVLFAFQIYGDFSGYSDIAIGIAKMLGFSLMRNFSYPYFSRDIAEFWRRWHISLSTWFRDYLYIPLGGSRVEKKSLLIRNVMIIFVVSGFWHGANWTFIFWGFLNALYFLPSILLNKNRKNLDIVAGQEKLPTLLELRQILTTFTLTCFAWIFFRSENISQAYSYISNIFSMNGSLLVGEYLIKLFFVSLSLILLIIIEWRFRFNEYPFQNSISKDRIYRWGYYFMIGILIIMNTGSKDTFIYFQF